MNNGFEDDWYGWRLRGRHLVSDDGQRMTIDRLRGLLWGDGPGSQVPPRLPGSASLQTTVRTSGWNVHSAVPRPRRCEPHGRMVIAWIEHEGDGTLLQRNHQKDQSILHEIGIGVRAASVVVRGKRAVISEGDGVRRSLIFVDCLGPRPDEPLRSGGAFRRACHPDKHKERGGQQCEASTIESFHGKDQMSASGRKRTLAPPPRWI
jgi:hypothetical protein